MKTAKLFKNGRSQAVRLPKEFRFEGNEVRIRREGDEVILSPNKDKNWEDVFFAAKEFDPDFIEHISVREQGEHQERDFLGLQ
ncbi:MAG: type II toxin-antitoxin system VapB family antitoxin [Bacteroidota bacterium]